MNIRLRRPLLRALAAAIVALAPHRGARAAQARSRTSRCRPILPVGAGSGVDTIVRSVAPSLSKSLGGQPVVIENLPGAGGITGTQAIVKAAADGLTIGVVSNNHVINPSVYRKMPFDSLDGHHADHGRRRRRRWCWSSIRTSCR